MMLGLHPPLPPPPRKVHSHTPKGKQIVEDWSLQNKKRRKNLCHCFNSVMFILNICLSLACQPPGPLAPTSQQAGETKAWTADVGQTPRGTGPPVFPGMSLYTTSAWWLLLPTSHVIHRQLLCPITTRPSGIQWPVLHVTASMVTTWSPVPDNRFNDSPKYLYEKNLGHLGPFGYWKTIPSYPIQKLTIHPIPFLI